MTRKTAKPDRKTEQHLAEQWEQQRLHWLEVAEWGINRAKEVV